MLFSPIFTHPLPAGEAVRKLFVVGDIEMGTMDAVAETVIVRWQEPIGRTVMPIKLLERLYRKTNYISKAITSEMLSNLVLVQV